MRPCFFLILLTFTALTPAAAEGNSINTNEVALTQRIEALEKSLKDLKKQVNGGKVKSNPQSPSSRKDASSITDDAFAKRMEALEKDLANLKVEVRSQKINPALSQNHLKDEVFQYRVGGRVRLDALYDTGSKGALYGLNPSTLPLKNIQAEASNHGHINAGVSSSRLLAEVSRSFDGLPTSAYMEFDFAKDSSNTTTSFSPRVRHLYVKAGGFLLGQTWYTFQDMDSFANTLDNLYGGSRQPMVKYTYEVSKCTSLAIAGEKPNTEYIGNDGNLHDNDQYGKSQLPDLATQLKLKHLHGHITFSGVIRRLQIHVPKAVAGLTDNFTKTKTGWGLGFSGRYNFYKKSGLMWQVNGGHGTGRYIDDLNSQDAYLQYGAGITPQFSIIKVINYIAGLELWLTNDLAATLAASLTHISKPKTSLNVVTYNTTQRRYHTNLIYNIFPNSQVGIEVMHYQRRAGLQTKNTGKDTRILSSFIYNF